MNENIADILKAQLAEPHPLRRNSARLGVFARLIGRLAGCSDTEASKYINMIEQSLESLKGCHCHGKMLLFLSIFCAGHPAMGEKAKDYFNSAKEEQQGETNRGGEGSFFREVYEAVAQWGRKDDETILEKWPLHEIGSIRFQMIKKPVVKYGMLINMLIDNLDDVAVNAALSKGEIDIVDDDSGTKVGTIFFEGSKTKREV